MKSFCTVIFCPYRNSPFSVPIGILHINENRVSKNFTAMAKRGPVSARPADDALPQRRVRTVSLDGAGTPVKVHARGLSFIGGVV